MNQKIVLGGLMLVFTAVQFTMYMTGYRGNTFIPPLIGAGITLIAAIILIVIGRKDIR